MHTLTHIQTAIGDGIEKRMCITVKYDEYTHNVDLESIIIEEQRFTQNGKIVSWSMRTDYIDATALLQDVIDVDGIDWESIHRENQLEAA